MRPAIASALDALGLPVDADRVDRFDRYLDLLQRWNTAHNLTAVRDRDAMVTQHLADCLAIVPPLSNRGGNLRVLDVGSGAGLPGLVIATMFDGWEVSCVDSVAKKMAFVRQAAGELGLTNLHAIHGRVESMRIAPCDIVTSRAFATLADFTRLTRMHLAPTGVWVAMKGRVPDDEIAALPADIDVFHVEQLAVPGLDAQRCLVWMRPRNTSQKD